MIQPYHPYAVAHQFAPSFWTVRARVWAFHDVGKNWKWTSGGKNWSRYSCCHFLIAEQVCFGGWRRSVAWASNGPGFEGQDCLQESVCVCACVRACVGEWERYSVCEIVLCCAREREREREREEVRECLEKDNESVWRSKQGTFLSQSKFFFSSSFSPFCLDRSAASFDHHCFLFEESFVMIIAICRMCCLLRLPSGSALVCILNTWHTHEWQF